MIIRQLTRRRGFKGLLSPCSRNWTRPLNETKRQSESQPKSLSSSQSDNFPPVEDALFSAPALSNPAVEEADPVGSVYIQLQKTKQDTGHLGTKIGNHYKPHALLIHPPAPQDVTLELLLASQAHFGHATSLWNPANQRYIFGIREGIHIISLDVTAAFLRRASKVVSGVRQRGGLILFVGTRPGQDRCVVNAARLAGGCHLFERWIPGAITNGQQILANCKLKAVDDNDDEIPALATQLKEHPVLKPDLVVCLNPLENYVLLHECGLNNIPTIGIIDTDADPTWVTYPIPANDDSLRCVQLIAGVLGRAGQEGLENRKAAIEASKQARDSYK
ncbi:MAG: 37S ribosomal protein, mitochondrial [Trizodia sp. TS-e1964]|nr:MAG: 37S ribosomal protein, mitochondrial [Trizodia sp. TS-e1964]